MMINYKMKIEDRDISVLKDIVLLDPVNARKRKVGRVMLLVLALFWFLAALLYLSQRKVNDGIGLLIIALICVVFSVLIPGYQKFILNRRYKKMNSQILSGTREYSFDENGVKIVSEYGSGTYNWESFAYWGIYKDYIYLKRVDGHFALADQKLLSEDDFVGLKELLEKHCKQI